MKVVRVHNMGGSGKTTLARMSAFRLQGVAAALGELARTHMEPDLALMVLDSLGLSLADLEAAGADPYDLYPLKRSRA